MSPKLDIRLKTGAQPGHITTGSIQVRIDGEAAWPAPGQDDIFLDVQIDDLLAYLTEFWKPILLRQVYPVDVSPPRPSKFRYEVERRWADIRSDFVAEQEDQTVSAFEEAHDLSRAFAGIYGLPSLWLMRDGEEMMVETSDKLWRIPVRDAQTALTKTGDQICRQLTKASERWSEAIAAWNDRSKGDRVALLAWSASLDRLVADSLVTTGVLVPPTDFADAVNDNDELRIAARMAGALPADQIGEIVRLARQFDRREVRILRSLSAECSNHVAAAFRTARPFAQGEAAACFVLDKLGISGEQSVDVSTVMTGLGIDIRYENTEPRALRGLAVWGGRHGPGVFVNLAGATEQLELGQVTKHDANIRVTLAHELCHLLLDSQHAFSAVEVLEGRMPARIEQRAKSFAGELLLPTAVAGRAWRQAGSPMTDATLEHLTKALARQFGVTIPVASWKLEHGAALYNAALGSALNRIFPYR